MFFIPGTVVVNGSVGGTATAATRAATTTSVFESNNAVLVGYSVATPRLKSINAPVVSPATTIPAELADNSGEFAVLPGGSLPSDADCAKRVKKTQENRPANAQANRTKGNANAPLSNWGVAAVPLAKRVSGNFAGTTDEIIQWAACKWGFDPDPVRAQVMVESAWRQGALGGYETNPAKCVDQKLRRVSAATTTTTTNVAPTTTTTTVAPDTTNSPTIPITTAPPIIYECPTAFGLLQVRSDYQPGTYPMSAKSTAYNLDYSLAMKRACYEGVGWLGAKTKGDAWGCVGVHYSGQWLDAAGGAYADRVKAVLSARSWE